jgi:hypothetical protein
MLTGAVEQGDIRVGEVVEVPEIYRENGNIM